MCFLWDIRQQALRGGIFSSIDGEKLEINTKTYQLSGYSAHADQVDLVAWVKQIPERPSKIKLVHGDDDAQAALHNILNI